MGGISCQVPHFAIMGSLTPPVQPQNASDAVYLNELLAFDAKLRQEYAQPDLVKGIVDADLADTVCPILAKSVWTPQERETLWNAILSLWPHETY